MRVWTVTKAGRVAVCQAAAHPLGLELVVSVGDDVRRTQAFRVASEAQTTANEWREAFLAYGWTDETDASTEH